MLIIYEPLSMYIVYLFCLVLCYTNIILALKCRTICRLNTWKETFYIYRYFIAPNYVRLK